MPSHTLCRWATSPRAGTAVQRSQRLVLLGLLCLAPLLHAQPAPVPAQPYPGDRIGLAAYGGGCPGVYLDPQQAPRIRQTGFTANPDGNPDYDQREYEVRYWSYVPPNQVCPLPPPMGYSQRIDIGPLPIGYHRFTVIGYLDGAEFNRYTTEYLTVRVGDRPGNNISGAWYAPEQSGRGLFVMRRENLTAFWWSNHDAEGRPAWVVMTDTNIFVGNHFEGEAITTFGPPMAPGPASIETQRWGELAFTYLGCGRGRMEWRADDEAIGEGAIDLVQLMVPDGITRCDFWTGDWPPAVWDPPK